MKRLAIQFKRGKRRSKALCISSVTFIGHLVNQRVAHEIIALEILMVLVTQPTEDSIEVAIALLKECGMKLTEVCRKSVEAIFEELRQILHEGKLHVKVQYMIEAIFQIRKDGFKDYESVNEELDLVDEESQFTHLVTLDEALDSQDILSTFKIFHVLSLYSLLFVIFCFQTSSNWIRNTRQLRQSTRSLARTCSTQTSREVTTATTTETVPRRKRTKKVVNFFQNHIIILIFNIFLMKDSHTIFSTTGFQLKLKKMQLSTTPRPI